MKDIPVGCLSDEDSLLLIAHELSMDTVVHVPLPAITYDDQDNKLHSRDMTGGLNPLEKKNVEDMNGKSRTNMSSSILTVLPQGPKAVKKLVDGSIARYCKMEKIGNHTSGLVMNSLRPWSPCSCSHEGDCQISESIFIGSLSHCSLPLHNEFATRTDSTKSQDCKRLRTLWLEMKDSMSQEASSI